MPDRVLLIAGAVALGDTPRARQWAHMKIAETMAWLLDGDAPLLVHGGCTDPQRAHPRDNVDWWADAIARAAGVTRHIYMAKGLVWVCRPPRFKPEPSCWKDGDAPDPKARNVQMVTAVSGALRAMEKDLGVPAAELGHAVRVVGLRAPWSQRNGTAHLLGRARRAQLPLVVEHLCPEAYGPSGGES